MTRVLFVCAGNVCRSPMAEGIFCERGLEDAFEMDSCGPGEWYAGESADPRAQEAIEVMDRANLRDLERAFPAHLGKARLLLERLDFGLSRFPTPTTCDLTDFEAVYATFVFPSPSGDRRPWLGSKILM